MKNVIQHGLVAVLGILGSSLSYADPFVGEKIAICEDGAEWPPYTHYQRVNGQATKEVVGFSVDVVNEIFKKHGIESKVDLIPWARCQAELLDGTTYQMALNASFNAKRDHDYLLVKPHYSIRSDYFYSKKNHPNALTINSVKDLQNYNVCGMLGYNYDEYGVKAVKLDQHSTDFSSMISKLYAGRCDLFIEKYEIMAGFKVTGQDFLADPNLGAAAIPGFPTSNFHMMISRKYPKAAALKEILEAGITEMEASGRLQELSKKYVP
jgi:polar amino acid transport system substrate-binding protein